MSGSTTRVRSRPILEEDGKVPDDAGNELVSELKKIVNRVRKRQELWRRVLWRSGERSISYD